MRFVFKTHYDQDIRLVKHGGQVFWYGLLAIALLIAPWSVGDYWMTQLSFILIYSIAGLGLMVLAGFTGPGRRSGTRRSSASAPTRRPIC